MVEGGRLRGVAERRNASSGRAEDVALDPGLLAEGRQKLSLTGRLRQPRTIASIVIPMFLLVLAVRSIPGFELETLPDRILHANAALLMLACVSYYAGFPLRGLRWRVLLRNADSRVSLAAATEIVLVRVRRWSRH